MREPGEYGDFVIPISRGSTDVVQTGRWGYQKPEPVSQAAPCQRGCPAGNPILECLSLAGDGKIDQAHQALLKENPFPGICGRVCFHPCEDHCNRKHYDEPVSIRAMERYVSDVTPDQIPVIVPRGDGTAKRAVCVGSGPAGLSFAYFLSLLGHRVDVLEAQAQPGGVMQWGIPEYRLPRAVLRREIQRIRSLGVDIRTGVKVGRDISFDRLGSYDAIFLSPGAGISIPLGIAGESLSPVLRGVDFLARINSSGSIDLGKEVVVIGGGNTAMDVARSARRFGADVTVAYRRTRAEMPAIAEEIEEAEEEGVRFEFLLQPARIEHAPSGRVAVTFQRTTLAAAGRGHRPRAIPIEGSYCTVDADHVITAVGEQVDVSWIPPGLVNSGVIEIKGGPGKIFAGGDAVDQPRSIVTAIAAGKRAAMSADLHFRGMAGLEDGSVSMEAYLAGAFRKPNPDRVATYDKLNTLYFEPSASTRTENLGVQERLNGFQEVTRGLSSAQAQLSAARCLSCGTCNYCGNCYYFCPEGAVSMHSARRSKSVDWDHCKGCGTCAKACPRGALEMKEWR